MENAQINQAVAQYERELGEPVVERTTAELLRSLSCASWDLDCGEFIVPFTEAERLTLRAFITAALQAEQDGAELAADMMRRDVGRIIVDCTRAYVNELNDRGLI